MQFQLSETFQLLLLAHLLADFVFQSNTMAVNKMHSNKVLFLHALIAGLTTYVIVFDFTAWVTPLLVVATHWVIDKIKIIVMEKGKIVETGTHKELIEKNGRYTELYRMQFKNVT